MNCLTDETGRIWEIGPRIGGGGEGEVFRIPQRPDLCAKLYFSRPLPAVQEAKLRALSALPLHSIAALPLGLLSASPKNRSLLGVLLPFVAGLDIHEVYNPEARQRKIPEATLPFLIATAKNVAFVFQKLHANGIVVGDVSEQNIRVLKDATVRLLDCDSVQLTTANSFFPCGVGSLLWTPPELQGKPLPRRIPNHDRFGLAQLIFLLLFGGRYPFSGTPAKRVSLDPGQAIASYAFAYDPQPPVRLLSPPKSALPFDSYPEPIQTLFLRAFRVGSGVPDARPSPQEWIEALGQLQDQLTVCFRIKTHWHWSGLASCPWCALARSSGIDLFPIPFCPTATNPILPHTFWPADAFQIPALALKPVAPALLQQALDPSATAPAWMQRTLQKIPRLRNLLDYWNAFSARAELQTVQENIQSLEKQVARMQTQAAKKIRALELQAQTHLPAPDLFNNLMQQAEEHHRQTALQSFLGLHPIETSAIRGLGKKRRKVLDENGIQTAADLEPERLAFLPMLGPGICARLMDYRQELERRFVCPSPNRQQVNDRAQQTFRQHLLAVQNQIHPILSEADSIRRQYIAKMEQAQAAFEELKIRAAVLQTHR